MEKNDVFKFTAPNGVEVTAIVIDIIKNDRDWQWYLCYSQNRLFHYQVIGWLDHPIITISVNYCVIPELDTLLYGDLEECSEGDEDLPIEYPHYDDELEALKSLENMIHNK